jgi:hypothetical protein
VDAFAERMRARPELRDLVAFAVLKDDAKYRVEKMVGQLKMPVLQDTPEVDFKRTFGVSGARAFYIFDRQGCLIECDVAVTPEEPGQLETLVPPLQRAAG